MDERCPNCGQDVPLVLRGVATYCSACGAHRPALGKRVLGITGRPAKLGGLAAKIAGGAVFGIGTFIALLITLVIQALWSDGWLGYAIGGPIAFLTLMLSGALFFGGRMLGQAGDRAIDDTRKKALRGLAKAKGGVLKAVQVADALHMAPAEADALLTEFAKEPSEDVGIDVSDEGEVLYLFGNPEAKRFRIRVQEAGLDEAFDDPEELAEALREHEAT
ncbi:MAG: hypothetical protein AAF411_32175 [Myxococcota bacterium]